MCCAAVYHVYSIVSLQVRVWDPVTLACHHILRRPLDGQGLLCMMALNGEVWAGVGDGVRLWGRE